MLLLQIIFWNFGLIRLDVFQAVVLETLLIHMFRSTSSSDQLYRSLFYLYPWLLNCYRIRRNCSAIGDFTGAGYFFTVESTPLYYYAYSELCHRPQYEASFAHLSSKAPLALSFSVEVWCWMLIYLVDSHVLPWNLELWRDKISRYYYIGAPGSLGTKCGGYVGNGCE